MKNQSSRSLKSARRSLACGLWGLAMVVPCLFFVPGCSSTPESGDRHGHAERQRDVLRVGVTPDYPPLVFEEGEYFSGAEIDLAHALGNELHRQVEFVSLKRDDQLNALNDGRADIIMSGVSITKARQLRAAFTDSYLTNQLRCVFRRTEAYKYQTVDDVLATHSRVGVLPGTTADIFVQQHCPDAQRIAMQNRRDVVFYLTDGGRIDLYIDDIFALAQMVSQNEAALAYLPDPLQVEELAWAVAPSNTRLRDQVNQILARWKTDGTLEATLLRWMPYLKKH